MSEAAEGLATATAVSTLSNQHGAVIPLPMTIAQLKEGE